MKNNLEKVNWVEDQINWLDERNNYAGYKALIITLLVITKLISVYIFDK